MINFIDTNIAIGYSISCDKFHVPSQKFIRNNKFPHYWSENVLNEFNRKFNDIFNEIETYLDEILELLTINPGNFINQYEFEEYILTQTKEADLDNFKKMKIIQFFWEKSMINFDDTPMELLYKFNLFLINYTNNFDSKKKELEKIVNLHRCGLKNFLKYTHYLYLLKEKYRVHSPDYKIVLDAHEFGQKNKVNFVTTDEKLHDKIINIEFLNIKKFTLCN